MKKHLRFSSKILGLAMILLQQHTIQAQLVSTFAVSVASESSDGGLSTASFYWPNKILQISSAVISINTVGYCNSFLYQELCTGSNTYHFVGLT